MARAGDALQIHQIEPASVDAGIRLSVRPERASEAYDYGMMLSFSDLHSALRSTPYFRHSTDTRCAAFVLDMPGDRAYFRGWDLHCALRDMSAWVEDARGFIYNRNVGGYLDELTIRRGTLFLRRHHTGYHDSSR